ncbi:hypothetical protein BSKO_07785 [Bryopsis sp. KO-2023]|nr:hypothetical protein BSKO_07785 [Bryopsis sp. KO-2023]
MGDASDEGPWERLRALAGRALSPVAPGEKIDPAPEELKQWGVNSTMVMASGLVLGGMRQWWIERKMADIPPPSNLATKAHIAQFKADMATRRLVRLLNATVRGGLWCGALGGLFYAVQGLSKHARQEDDAYNTVFGAWASGGVMGILLGSGGPTQRLGSMALGAGVAGLIGFPMGLAQQYIVSMTVDEEQGDPLQQKEKTPEIAQPQPSYPTKDYDLVGAAVNELESKLAKGKRDPGQ